MKNDFPVYTDDEFSCVRAVRWDGSNIEDVRELIKGVPYTTIEWYCAPSDRVDLIVSGKATTAMIGDYIIATTDSACASVCRGDFFARIFRKIRTAYARYTARDNTIEAIQWTGKNIDDVKDFVSVDPDVFPFVSSMSTSDMILTLRRGTFDNKVHIGDYITRDCEAHMWVICPEDFELRFIPCGPQQTDETGRTGAHTESGAGCSAADADQAAGQAVPKAKPARLTRGQYEEAKPKHDAHVVSVLTSLAEAEAEFASARYGDYHSPHEGLAVIEEELYEVSSAEDDVACGIDSLRMRVFHNDDIAKHRSTAEGIHEYAVALAQEAIHVAATAKRYIQSVDAAGGEFSQG